MSAWILCRKWACSGWGSFGTGQPCKEIDAHGPYQGFRERIGDQRVGGSRCHRASRCHHRGGGSHAGSQIPGVFLTLHHVYSFDFARQSTLMPPSVFARLVPGGLAGAPGVPGRHRVLRLGLGRRSNSRGGCPPLGPREWRVDGAARRSTSEFIVNVRCRVGGRLPRKRMPTPARRQEPQGVAGCGPGRPRRSRARRIGARRQHLWIPIGGQLFGLLRVGDIADWFITS
jgi:hypothetical protein